MKKKRIIHKNTAAEREEYRRKVAEEVSGEQANKKKVRRIRQRVELDRVQIAEACSILKAERERQGLSLSDMEMRTGISRGAISRLENLLDSNPTVATLSRLANALGKQLTIGLEPQK